MSVLRLHGVRAAWAAPAPLYSVSLTLDHGFYGLVGANGAGQTTFLSVIAGALAPSEGTVTPAPRNAVVASCRQTVDRRDEGIAAERRDRRALAPSERKRWQIAAALASEPGTAL